MIQDTSALKEHLIDEKRISDAEREELLKLGILTKDGDFLVSPNYSHERPPIRTRAVHASGVLNEAYDYFPRPSSFSRALAFDFNGYKVLLISGTASIDDKGKTVNVGDFRAQCWRTYRNITEILEAEGMNWHNIVRTSCYLRDIERDYNDFNDVRTAFFHWLKLDPLPASTGIQARLCREDLLVEIEAIAVSQPTRD